MKNLDTNIDNYYPVTRNITVGCTVKIVDGSYMVNASHKEIDHTITLDGKEIGYSKAVWVVKVINIHFPTHRIFKDILTPINNCMIENPLTGEQFYCNNVNIIPIRPTKLYCDHKDQSW